MAPETAHSVYSYVSELVPGQLSPAKDMGRVETGNGSIISTQFPALMYCVGDELNDAVAIRISPIAVTFSCCNAVCVTTSPLTVAKWQLIDSH